MTKVEIEKDLEGKGDFVKIDHLKRFLEQDIAFETKKFVYFKLAEIYEKKGMFNDAGKIYENISMLSTSFSEKIQDYVKGAELYIKGGFFNRADESIKKAFSQANLAQKADIYIAIKNFYKRQAEVYERELRRSHAVKIYEKLLTMKISESEKQEIKDKLINLYEKLGRIKEYYALRK